MIPFDCVEGCSTLFVIGAFVPKGAQGLAGNVDTTLCACWSSLSARFGRDDVRLGSLHNGAPDGAVGPIEHRLELVPGRSLHAREPVLADATGLFGGIHNLFELVSQSKEAAQSDIRQTKANSDEKGLYNGASPFGDGCSNVLGISRGAGNDKVLPSTPRLLVSQELVVVQCNYVHGLVLPANGEGRTLRYGRVIAQDVLELIDGQVAKAH